MLVTSDDASCYGIPLARASQPTEISNAMKKDQAQRSAGLFQRTVILLPQNEPAEKIDRRRIRDGFASPPAWSSV